jgi:hypothetical protein
MATATWSALSAESSDLGSTLNSKAHGTVTLIADIANATPKDIYLEVWLDLASINPTGAPSITLSLRRKRGSTYAENAVETFIIPVSTGASAKPLHAVMRIPNAADYGLYWTNNLNVTTAASGNTLFYRTWDEEIA